jgi:hypothetical protein
MRRRTPLIALASLAASMVAAPFVVGCSTTGLEIDFGDGSPLPDSGGDSKTD